jgi:transcriptional repressor NrdR
MRCIYCGSADSKVIDSRLASDNAEIRRRRECVVCGKRFSTHETPETAPLLVVKNDGNRQTFDPDKIKAGLLKACEKRPVPAAKIDKLVSEITRKLYNSLEQEITSKQIGELVMAGLKDIDEVAYIRFASVYRQFRDIESFLKELEGMLGSKLKDDKKR